jgi:hypothetical protein
MESATKLLSQKRVERLTIQVKIGAVAFSPELRK